MESEPVADWQQGYYMTMAPLIVNGKVMVGVSGGEFGVRGFIAAYDAASGQQAWKTYTIRGQASPVTTPGKATPGSAARVGLDDRHLRTREQYRLLGHWQGLALVRRSAARRQPVHLVDGGDRSGQRRDQGAFPPLERFRDWDEMNAPMVVDYEKDGQTGKGLLKTSRNGYLYWLERGADGQIGYVNATNYVKQDVFASIDSKSGRPTYNDDHKPAPASTPSSARRLGGKDWPYEAYNPTLAWSTSLPTTITAARSSGKVQEYVAGQWWTGVDIPDIGFTVDKNAKSYGEIQAWNVNTEREWTHLYPVMNWGSLLTTGGGLVFNGGTNDRMFRAFDARTGEQRGSSRPTRDHGAAVVLCRTACSTSPCSPGGASIPPFSRA